MASFTENYNLIKPGQEDIYNIDDFNDNADIIDAELKDRVPRTGDISDTQITTFDTITEEFPVPVAGEATRTVAGKIRKFFQDFNNFKTGILTVGMLVNNAVTNNSQLPVSAAVAKTLQDQTTQLNGYMTAALKYLGNLVESTDLNNPPAEYGICLITEGAANSPSSNAGIMLYHTAGGSSSNGVELAVFRATSAIYIRSRLAGAWSQWYSK